MAETVRTGGCLCGGVEHSLTGEPVVTAYYPEKILGIRDGLPKYKDFDPAFGGTGEVVLE